MGYSTLGLGYYYNEKNKSFVAYLIIDIIKNLDSEYMQCSGRMRNFYRYELKCFQIGGFPSIPTKQDIDNAIKNIYINQNYEIIDDGSLIKLPFSVSFQNYVYKGTKLVVKKFVTTLKTTQIEDLSSSVSIELGAPIIDYNIISRNKFTLSEINESLDLKIIGSFIKLPNIDEEVQLTGVDIQGNTIVYDTTYTIIENVDSDDEKLKIELEEATTKYYEEIEKKKVTQQEVEQVYNEIKDNMDKLMKTHEATLKQNDELKFQIKLLKVAQEKQRSIQSHWLYKLVMKVLSK